MTKQEKEFLIQLTETISLIQDCLLKVGQRLQSLEKRTDNIERTMRDNGENELMEAVAQKVEQQNA